MRRKPPSLFLSTVSALTWFLHGQARAQYNAPVLEPIQCAEPIDSDSLTRKDRAKEHYRRGQELYTQGEYERAIPEFLAAYCLVPVPEAIYNIGQACERLVDFEQAVFWFERYILALPSDSPKSAEERETVGNRVAVLRRLPARIRVATEPPGATVTLTGPPEPIVGKANDKDPIRVPAGKYTMHVELPGYEPATEPIIAEIGQPYTYSFHLTPVMGRIRVTTEPGDARVFVDQRLVGVGTYIDRLPIGAHELTVEAPGREPHKRAIEILANDTQALHVRLPTPPKSGRSELLAGSTFFGGVAGIGIYATIFRGDKLALLPPFMLVGGGIGYGAVHLGAPPQIPIGTTSYILGGAVWGAMEGIGLALTLTDEQPWYAPSVFAGATAGVVGTALTSRRLKLSAGDSALINSGALWGTMSGLLFWAAFDRQDDLAGPLLLTGVNAGLVAGATLAVKHEISRGHVALIDLSGLAGMTAGILLASSLENQGQANRFEHFALGGLASGLVLGAFLTRKVDVRSAPLGVATAMPSLSAERDARGRPLLMAHLTGEW
ncbi:MAG: PEGA domain-containing protein [Deltaproteobacteria bacterium]|nr:PEGA domain-containing protein [Deltaproteobacteria bacterium]